MDAALKSMRLAVRDPLLVIAVTPVIPHILGSVFNIWYNLEIVDPLLRAAGLRERFISTVIVWNAFAFRWPSLFGCGWSSSFDWFFASCFATK
jgi:hypothetical protein